MKEINEFWKSIKDNLSQMESLLFKKWFLLKDKLMRNVNKCKIYCIYCINKLIERYWALPRKVRRKVGMFLLASTVAIICGVCYIIYSCVAVNLVQWVSSFGEETIIEEEGGGIHIEDEPEFTFKVNKHLKKRFNYARDFNDLNETQLAAAKRVGIRPIDSREDAEKLKDVLVELRTCQYYMIDPLTHSIPYLVPKAYDFLTELGILFQEYSGTNSRFIITSVTRTRQDVKKLRRSGNVNASENSCHFYGTTIDITYNRFDKHGNTWEGNLKAQLAEALYDLRAAGYCYVKYEYKQACFHITVRPY